jgi:hypothetical protein
VPWRGGVRNIILLHTHIIISQHFTNNFSLHTTFTLDTVINRERPTFVGFCSSIPTWVIVSSTFFTMGNWEFLHCLSLLPQGKSKTGIFQRLSKNAWNATAQINYGVARCSCSFTLAVHIHFIYPQETGTWRFYSDIAGCWLRKEYSVLVIITKMEQVVMHRIAILFQLVYSLLFTDQSVYFCVSNCRWN